MYIQFSTHIKSNAMVPVSKERKEKNICILEHIHISSLDITIYISLNRDCQHNINQITSLVVHIYIYFTTCIIIPHDRRKTYFHLDQFILMYHVRLFGTNIVLWSLPFHLSEITLFVCSYILFHLEFISVFEFKYTISIRMCNVKTIRLSFQLFFQLDKEIVFCLLLLSMLNR